MVRSHRQIVSGVSYRRSTPARREADLPDSRLGCRKIDHVGRQLLDILVLPSDAPRLCLPAVCRAAAALCKLTTGQKAANIVISDARAPGAHDFSHLINWHVLTKLHTDPARAPDLLRALLLLTNLGLAR